MYVYVYLNGETPYSQLDFNKEKYYLMLTGWNIIINYMCVHQVCIINTSYAKGLKL